MARRRYLIAYDIREPARLRRVAKVMESFGERLQYSVFLCDLSGVELVAWRTCILDVVQLSEDSIVTIDLGPPGARDIAFLGTHRPLPSSATVIV